LTGEDREIRARSEYTVTFRIDDDTEIALGSSAAETTLAAGTELAAVGSAAIGGVCGPTAARDGVQPAAPSRQAKSMLQHRSPGPRAFAIGNLIRARCSRDLKNLHPPSRQTFVGAFVSSIASRQARDSS
jgi:hypothetical protein